MTNKTTDNCDKNSRANNGGVSENSRCEEECSDEKLFNNQSFKIRIDTNRNNKEKDDSTYDYTPINSDSQNCGE